MSVSRNEGYSKGKPKEELALNVFRRFCKEVLAVDNTFITDKDENWIKGDFRLANGLYIEVKGQPIDPSVYSQNFVELGEITNREYHREGFSKLKSLLNIDNLEKKLVNNKPIRKVAPLGAPEHFSLSITSLSNNTSYCYINYNKNIVYLYSAERLIKVIQDAIKSDIPLLRGAGNSNDVSIAALVALPSAIWKLQGAEWKFIGSGNEEKILEAIRRA